MTYEFPSGNRQRESTRPTREGTEGHDPTEISKVSISLMITGIFNPHSNTIPLNPIVSVGTVGTVGYPGSQALTSLFRGYRASPCI
jgi:hypothetical protein